MEVSNNSGQSYEAKASYPKGHQNNPLSDDELEVKFRSLSTGIWSDNQSSNALDMLWSLEDLDGLDDVLSGLVV